MILRWTVAFLFLSLSSLAQSDTLKYPWLQPEFNILQFYNRKPLENFYRIWKKAQQERLSVVHLGDSHLQADILPGQLRKRLQAEHGDGGRGLMFSFSTARTYSSIDYNTSHTGAWLAARAITTRPKVTLGLRGMACRTLQPNSTLIFDFKVLVPDHHTLLKIFCKKGVVSYDLIAEVGNQKIPVKVDTLPDLPYVIVHIPSISKRITLRVVKTQPIQSEFEFYGMSLEAESPKGTIFHNAGVGAARYQSVLYEPLFVDQLKALEPDLVIIDFGTNDYLYDDKIKPELETEIKKVIEKVKTAQPEAVIILTTAQDLYWRRINVKSGVVFAELIHKIASQTDCLVYDWYWVAGGQGVMLKWMQAKLAQTDLIHLTMSGYRLKGNMFFEAMKKTIEWYEQHPQAEALVIATDSLKVLQKKKVPVSLASTPLKSPISSKNVTIQWHTIMRGETLYAISKKYGVTVEELKEWNQLNSNNIIAGQQLMVRKRESVKN